MKKITKEELDVFLRKHKLWLEGKNGGKRADLSVADLRGADLSGAYLSAAYLSGADLSAADLRGADLSGAYLSAAYLSGADLSAADLRGADLSGAYLSGADLSRAYLSAAYLSGADLSAADLRGADLSGADLSGADLSRADLSGADLRRADLRGAKNIYIPIACPEEGSFTAFKKVRGDLIVKLLVPEDARRCSATSRKCRCDKAIVLSITKLDGSEADVTSAASKHDHKFIYTVGETVSVDNFCEDRWSECSQGIHFFITRKEAEDY